MARVTGVALMLLAAAIGAASACTTAGTRLSITVYPQGRGHGVAHRYRLQCGPASGTVPDPARACRTLARLTRPFAPVPPGTVCSQIALGPQEAIVTGSLRGRRVWVRLRLRNSCEIARWRRLGAVVPGFP